MIAVEELELQEGMTGMMSIMDESGDKRFQWNKNDPAQVAKAEAQFNEMKSKGYMMYSVTKKGDKGTVLTAFDPSAERLIGHSQMIGG